MADYNGLLANPWLNVGMGLLGSRGDPSGAMQGLLNAQKSAYQMELMQQMQAKREQEQQAMQARQQLAGMHAMAPVQNVQPGNVPDLSPPGPAYNMDPMQRELMQNLALGAPGVFDSMMTQAYAPPAPKMTDDIREYMVAQGQGYKGSLQDWILAQKKAGGTKLNILPGEKSYDVEMGKLYTKNWKSLNDAVTSERKKLYTLRDIDSLLKDVYTGTGGEALVAAKKAARALGINLEGVGQAEAGRALSSQLALQYRNTASGEGMPGHLSDKDREFLMQMTPNLAMTEQGRKNLVEVQRRLYERARTVQKMAHEYVKEHGRLNEGFDIQLADFVDQNQLFGDINMEKIEQNAPIMTDDEYQQRKAQLLK